MNILLIGNGFDLAHGLPTKYTDFLEFIQMFKEIRTRQKKDELRHYAEIEKLIKSHYSACEFIRREVASWFNDSMRKKEIMIAAEELKNLIADNFWLEYFFEYPRQRKENWIDFEGEICKMIKDIDNDMQGKDFGSAIPHLKNEYLRNRYLYKETKKKRYGECRERSYITYQELRDELLRDLNRLIRAFEIYLCTFVEKLPCNGILPDIQDACFDKVLSFNYTDTYRKKYDKQGNVEYDFIHGKANMTSTIDTNNMVLGIDEYLSEKRKNTNVEFIAFKKYYQRIYKGTGCCYKNWIDEMETKAVSSTFYGKRSNLYIFGHSLDVTDKDILRELILNDHIDTTIFYFSKDDFGIKIANLVKVIGQDELIRRTGGISKTICFKQQQNVITI